MEQNRYGDAPRGSNEKQDRCRFKSKHFSGAAHARSPKDMIEVDCEGEGSKALEPVYSGRKQQQGDDRANGKNNALDIASLKR